MAPHPPAIAQRTLDTLRMLSSLSADPLTVFRVESGEIRHVWTDPRVIDVTGFSARSNEGRRVSEVMPPELWERFRTRVERALTAKAQVRFKSRVQLPAGERTLELALTPLELDDSGPLIGITVARLHG